MGLQTQPLELALRLLSGLPQPPQTLQNKGGILGGQALASGKGGSGQDVPLGRGLTSPEPSQPEGGRGGQSSVPTAACLPVPTAVPPALGRERPFPFSWRDESTALDLPHCRRPVATPSRGPWLPTS